MPEGLKFERYFSKGNNPYDDCFFEKRNAAIRDDNGKMIESLDDVIVPKNWSQDALNIVATKYLRKEALCADL